MENDHESFAPETVDEQIEHATSLSPEESHLIDLLKRTYHASASENAQSLNHVWQHMQYHLSQANSTHNAHSQPDISTHLHRESDMQTDTRPSFRVRRSGLIHRLNIAAAVLLAVLVIGSMIFIFHIVSPYSSGTTIVQPGPTSTVSASGIYISSAADNKGGFLISRVDMTSHRIIWSKPIGTLTSSIAVQENTVYVSAMAGPHAQNNDVYAFDTTSGTLRWQSIVSQQGPDDKLTTPAVSGETVYVLSQDGTVSALSTSKGKLLWSYKTNTLYNPGDVAVANGIVYATMRTGLFAIDATSGKLVWSQQTDPTQILDSPSVVGSSVYLASYSVPPKQLGIAHSGFIYSYDAKSGMLNWQHAIDDWVLSTPTVVNGIVYAGSPDMNLYALKASDGSELWHYTTDGQIFDSPLVSNGVVYVEESGNATATATGNQPSTVNPALFAIDATKGTELWSQPLDITPQTIQNGVIYGTSSPHDVYALKASDGSTIWHQQYGPDLIDKFGNPGGAITHITVIP